MEPRREDISEGMGGIINRVAVYRNFPNGIHANKMSNEQVAMS